MERVEILNKYYTILDYDEKDQKEIELKEHDIYKKISFEDNDDISKRLEILAQQINLNMPFFKTLCKHVDDIYTILRYLTDYSMIISSKSISNIEGELKDIPCPLALTLATMCTNPFMQAIFMDNLINISKDIINVYEEFEVIINRDVSIEINAYSQMIILEDSDLYAVINCLIIKDQFTLYKIWVQEQVKEKFVWLTKNYELDLSVITDIFQSVHDIQFHPHEHIINIISIWSEDIMAAKNLALSLNCHVIFINTFMDFGDSLILLPYKDLIRQKLREAWLNHILIQNESSDIEFSDNVVHLSISEINDSSDCNLIKNLFYDGMWQKPTTSMYWKHNGFLWANATHNDIKKCYESAKKGFKTWSIMSIKTRIQILSRFMSTLNLTGKFVLAAILERWIKFPYFYDIVQGIQNEMVEVLYTRKPLGVFILREENENVLFFRLIQTLIAGNSVIVMFDANFCDLSSYYDMFSTCGIPPGVINLLLHEDTSTLEYKLCLEKYTNYAKKIFLKGTSLLSYTRPYENLTILKHIIIPVE